MWARYGDYLAALKRRRLPAPACSSTSEYEDTPRPLLFSDRFAARMRIPPDRDSAQEQLLRRVGALKT